MALPNVSFVSADCSASEPNRLDIQAELTEDDLFQRMKALYWDAASKEIGNMLLFYIQIPDEAFESPNQNINSEVQGKTAVECSVFGVSNLNLCFFP
jgi:hypothetical protein